MIRLSLVKRRTFSVFALSCILVLIYIAIDKNVYSVLNNWKTVSTVAYYYDLESLRQTFKYSAQNIFEAGYVREVEAELYRRLSTYPDGGSLNDGIFFIPSNSSRNTVRLSLPEEFKEGILSLRIASISKFSVGISSDLKKWESYDYSGFGVLTYYVVPVRRNNIGEKYFYIKFLPAVGEKMQISFNVFQYISSMAHDEKNDYGIMFFPEIDIDYQGKQVIMPAIIYGKNITR